MNRYSRIDTKLPREFILLQGTGCRWRKCTFCDYHDDVSSDPFGVNKPVLDQVTGQYGVLDVINSGSAPELDPQTVAYLRKIVQEKGIHTLWFEAHWMYRHILADFAAQFAPALVKFRCGVETFDTQLREQWKKGVPSDVTPEDIARHFEGVCLLCGTKGEEKGHIVSDIETALKHFEYMSVNLFCPNNTAVESDSELIKWFEEVVYPQYKDHPSIEILLQNTDLGVGD